MSVGLSSGEALSDRSALRVPIGRAQTSIRKRHRYVTVIVSGDTGEVLAMVPHRDSATPKSPSPRSIQKCFDPGGSTT